jgi:hypothetical protein
MLRNSQPVAGNASSKGASHRAGAAPGGASRLHEAPKYSACYIFCCISYYFVVSLSLTFLNKMILTTMIKFSCPLFMTWLQFVVAFACLKALGHAGLYFPSIQHHFGILDYHFSKDTFKSTFRLGIAYVAMYVPVSPLLLLLVQRASWIINSNMSLFQGRRNQCDIVQCQSSAVSVCSRFGDSI